MDRFCGNDRFGRNLCFIRDKTLGCASRFISDERVLNSTCESTTELRRGDVTQLLLHTNFR